MGQIREQSTTPEKQQYMENIFYFTWKPHTISNARERWQQPVMEQITWVHPSNASQDREQPIPPGVSNTASGSMVTLADPGSVAAACHGAD